MNLKEKVGLSVVMLAIIVVGAFFGLISPPGGVSTTTTTSALATTAAPEQILEVDYTGFADTLDPGVSVVIAGNVIYQNIYQPLLYFNNSDIFTIVPVLAESYSFSKDGLSVTFKIRKGIRFSNGDPLNGYCVWYSWYRAEVMKQAAAFFYDYYTNMPDEVKSGLITAAHLNQLNSTDNMPPPSLIPVIANASSSISVPDPYTVVFRLKGPFPDLAAWLARAEVVDPRVIWLHGGVSRGQPNKWVALNPIGTGPFILESWVQGAQAVLVQNPNYWGGPGGGVFPKPKLSKVVIHYVQSQTTRELDLTTGKVQIATIELARMQVMNGTPGLVLPKASIAGKPMTLTWAYLHINTHMRPLDNILVREAVVHAINGDQLNQTIFLGQLYYTGGVTPYPLIGNNPDLKQYKYDPELSKSLLARAGYPEGKGLPSIRYVYSTDSAQGLMIAQIVQANLADVGITVELRGMTFAQQLALDFSIPPSSPDAIGIQWTSATNFPSSAAYAGFNFMSYSKGGLGNFVDYSDPVIDDLILQASTTYDNAVRDRLYREAGQRAYDAYAFYWFGNVKLWSYVFSTKVKGYYYNSSFAGVDLSTVYLSS